MLSKAFYSEHAPKPAGPYMQAVQRGPMLALAGQVGIDPVTGEIADGIAAQTRQALDNIAAVLDEVGATFNDVIHMRVYLADWNDFQAMNAEYSRRFPVWTAARTTVVVTLPPGMLIEIDGLAVRDQ